MLPHCEVCHQRMSLGNTLECRKLPERVRVYPVHTLNGQYRAQNVEWICAECFRRGRARMAAIKASGEELPPLEAEDWLPPDKVASSRR